MKCKLLIFLDSKLDSNVVRILDTENLNEYLLIGSSFYTLNGNYSSVENFISRMSFYYDTSSYIILDVFLNEINSDMIKKAIPPELFL